MTHIFFAALALAAAAKPPPFSWRTVPVFAETSNVTGPFDDTAVSVLTKFSVVVGEKAYDYPDPGFAEDKLAALAKQLRQLKPNIFLIFYYNANLDMDDYRLNALSKADAPHWWVRNSSGVPMVAPVDSGAGSRPPFPYAENDLGGLHCWDFTNPAVREAWSQECLNVTSPAGGFDGCMLDRWTRNPFGNQPGYTKDAIAAWHAGQNQSEALLLEKAHAKGIWVVGEGNEVDAISDPGFFSSCKSDAGIHKQLRLVANGQGLLASYKPGAAGAAFTSTLASFLIGAGERHYFGAGSWTCNHTSREGVTWHPEYDQPLGDPIGPAVQGEDGTWRRSFKLGTNVTVNNGVGHIDWADW